MYNIVMNICIYAICRNESKFVDRFMKSIIDANVIVICDTGSTDKTINKLEEWREKYPDKIKIHSISVSPWRFDLARNISLGLVPTDVDVCVCIDLDEILTEGWRSALEEVWTPETTRLRYTYVWSWASPGVPGIVQQSDKIHSRNGYIWRHPCHEVLYDYGLPEVQTHAGDDTLAVHHHPDESKPRSQYLPLLEMGVKENPWCDRSAYYLAREYFYYGRYEEAISEFERHRSLPSLYWNAERAASHRHQAQALTHLGRLKEARDHFALATENDPLFRDGWNDLAMADYLLNDWESCYRESIRAISITKDHGTYIMDQKAAFGPRAYDLAAISSYNLGLIDDAEQYAMSALELDQKDERLQKNLAIIREKLRQKDIDG